MEYTKFSQFEEIVRRHPVRHRMAIAVAGDEHTLQAALHARREGICDPICVGDRAEILAVLAQLGETVPDCDIYDEPDPVAACEKAVALVREGKADFLMKGRVDTGVILKAVVNKDHGLGTGRIMSHFTMHQVSGYHKLIAPVDGGMVTYPTLEQKKTILENTVAVMRALGYDKPKVGVLCAVEKVNPKMPETLDADALRQMYLRGEITGCIVEGPISYDCAVSKEIADFKGLKSEIAGEVDILLVPNIHVGNVIGKIYTTTCGGMMAGFITGAKCPVVVSSRGSNATEKFNSIVLAAAASASMGGHT
jgi:phosphate butyryltransferase